MTHGRTVSESYVVVMHLPAGGSTNTTKSVPCSLDEARAYARNRLAVGLPGKTATIYRVTITETWEPVEEVTHA